jgi:hypothetical protein
MLSHLQRCQFGQLPDGALFVELPESGQEPDFGQEQEIHEKCGDRDLVVVGHMVDGVVYIDGSRGMPTPDHINSRSKVIFIDCGRVEVPQAA